MNKMVFAWIKSTRELWEVLHNIIKQCAFVDVDLEFESPYTRLEFHGYILTVHMREHTLLHFKLHSITPVATKVHVILQIFVALTWMHDTMELV